MSRLLVATLAACVLTAATPSAATDAFRYRHQSIDKSVSPRDDFESVRETAVAA